MFKIRDLMFAIVFVFLCGVSAIASDRPPEQVVKYLTSLQVIHDDKCTVEGITTSPTECLVLFDASVNIVFVMLFTDDIVLTHILATGKGKVEIVWREKGI